MIIESTYNRWDVTRGAEPLLIIKVVPRIIMRPFNLGETTHYGSSIFIPSSSGKREISLSVTDRSRPNITPSLTTVLSEHATQIGLGTFEEVKSPFHTTSSLFLTVLWEIDKQFPDVRVSQFTQIPIFFEGEQHWDFRSGADQRVYQAYRKYDNGYYTTKIVRVLDCYKHPFLKGVKDGNVIKREESIEYTSMTAKPFIFEDEIKVFS